ncbi:protein LAZ1 homolog 1-like isoform X1 [Carya illinoinensis]|uniref:Uncharacterized protein n=2 Tax=Carya illinoinensis TaxID=32201 RepID=A0A8T1NAJ5_CARIL|nr:protein LAZ1 homolog 1-like isoform X1 [Carya illinoinensis]XP_042962989.1 protein LAZ1 homolog 1-like isoform X1 [Carya illinoinensis]KAG6626064.1 hypothetical protein CIPAW_15G021000 [Carya illinoinensis]KAG6674021.1 hypothetical protein I3842_15G021500 [Carya illinoinensis]
MWLLHLGAEFAIFSSWPIFSASIFVAVAVVLSMYLIFEHLAAYNQPEEQKFLIGLVLMVPVYALESFLSLLNSDAAFNCEVIRDCYEAFALYCFERYLIACLGGEEKTIEFMENQGLIDFDRPLLKEAYTYGVVEHPFPLNCVLRDWYLGPNFYNAVKIGIVQYMILKMICALLAMILEVFGVYGEGKFEWRYGYPYLAVVLNFSQTWALYCLLQFYTIIKDKLEPIKPLAKFLTFKSIVFLTWWQGITIAFLFSMGVFKGSLAQELKTRIQDYIICIEMGVAAMVHLYVFPAVPYKRGERCVRNVAVMANYASLDAPPDTEEVQDSERSTIIRMARHDEREKRLNFPQSVRDVVVGSGGIIVDDMKYTVSHVVEPVERGIAKINETFHQISENVKRYEEQRRSSKDDSYIIPMNSWSTEFSEVNENLVEGSISDSGLSNGKRQHHQSKASASGARTFR